MKFGKRLAAEASRRYEENYFDYKTIKHSIKDDITAADAGGTNFQRMLVGELQKVSQFYSTKATQLETTFNRCIAEGCTQQLSELRTEVQELIKFVALNYLAVVKAIKKRNRHLREHFGAAANTSLHALDLLIGEVFFTSPRLANLATQAEVLSRELAARGGRTSGNGSTTGSHPAAPAAAGKVNVTPAAATQLLEEYTCPVCLDTLHNPVVLTCAHRFCWGCLVAHCTATRDSGLPIMGAKEQSSAAGASNTTAGMTTSSPTYRLLEQVAASEPDTPTFYPCPVCRKPQILDIDTLQVDSYLEQFITNLQAISNVSVSAAPLAAAPSAAAAAAAGTCCAQAGHHHHGIATATTVLVQQAQQQQQQQQLVMQLQPAAYQPWGIIPPQPAEHKGKLTVLLDLDGTLVSSFTPKRAPRLPYHVRTHVVGVGSKLNPQGVFVVERPGLGEFLRELAAFAEVIVFTAGLEDYASPIIDAIDPQRKFFVGRIYREGTLRTEHYQCVKDMARINRELTRTVLLDDTPLAFLHQPDNGIPILGFRGDPDDRLLLEAALPLLQTLANERDVQPVLRRRFDMGSWFKRHGFPVTHIVAQALADADEERRSHGAAAIVAAAAAAKQLAGAEKATTAAVVQVAAEAPVSQQQQPVIVPAGPPTKQFLLLTDFDKTLTDFDAGERVMEALAPELLPMLVGLECPTNFIPITNTLLAELQRRGVSRDQLLTTLHELGAELPAPVQGMLRAVHAAGVDVKVLSDCNSVFISHMLAGAKVAGCLHEVLTNPATFERVGNTESSSSSSWQQQQKQHGAPHHHSTHSTQHSYSGSAHSQGHKLVVKPRHLSDRPPHHCKRCPENLCKGAEVRALRQAGTYRTIIYAGDGANDVCAALALGPGDVVLARSGYALAAYLSHVAEGAQGVARPQATVKLWSTHEELASLVQSLTAAAV